MKTQAVRMYGKKDLRLESFELPPITEREILAEVISDSLCMSTWKAAQQGTDHKRVPADIATRPVIVGHEFCGRILEVGAAWRDQFRPGQKFAIQPAINYKGSLYSPGYSYPYIGGNATHIIIPAEVMELNCLLPYDGDAFFYGSLAEPMSCIVGTFHAMYHTQSGRYDHFMGIREGGKMALLAAAGPMGLGAVDYAIHGPVRPSLLVVTDIDDARLKRAAQIITPEEAARQGVRLVYLNTASGDAVETLRGLSGGEGYDDVVVLAPVRAVVEQADAILGRDGCLNFFAGPGDPKFSANFNFYNVHYASTHVVGTSGGNTDDLIESLDMMAAGKLNPAGMITHVGGLNAAVETTLNLPTIPGGKKLIYTHIDLPLTAIADFGKIDDPLMAELASITRENGGLWCARAEEYLLEHGAKIQ
ncbi:MAG: zinc-binding dehydrogenase [Clostridiales bacterium]|nr:zinc-binding dehydrogenase [Clostridiales bacterium]